MTTTTLRKNWQYITIALLAAMLVAASTWALLASNRANERQASDTTVTSRDADTGTQLQEQGITPLTTSQASNNPTTADDLAYMIEEEKLAHDVYQALYDKWGSRVFANILNSETSHQNLVWAVMESRDLSDPRKDEVGVFTNQDLQALYDTLVAQGLQSQTEAYKAGVIIEERDIADLKETISNLETQDTDVKGVLDTLLRGSENHLRAFNRQLSR